MLKKIIAVGFVIVMALGSSITAFAESASTKLSFEPKKTLHWDDYAMYRANVNPDSDSGFYGLACSEIPLRIEDEGYKYVFPAGTIIAHDVSRYEEYEIPITVAPELELLNYEDYTAYFERSRDINDAMRRLWNNSATAADEEILQLDFLEWPEPLVHGYELVLTEEMIGKGLVLATSREGIMQIVVEKGNLSPSTKNPSITVLPKATPTASKVYINDKDISFDAYNIEGNNYFKLRDLAYSLSGTDKQFEISWDSAENAINLLSNKPYTVTNGEMAKGDGVVKEAQITASEILLNGQEVQLTAYNINGNNYFKLRDIGNLFDFAVEWDGATNSIKIDTSKSYTE